MTRRNASGWRAVAGDTLVLGLMTLAIGAVAVLISYRAQNGLPWVSTYRISVDVPDGGKLLKNADVRIGGARVGQVLAIEPQPAADGGRPFARLRLALTPAVEPLPADTTAAVRLASVLGGKFLDLVPGEAGGETIPDGGVLALDNALGAIEIEDALRVFGPGSRGAIRALIGELGVALAGRGASVNEALGAAGRLTPAADRVLGALASPGTDLAGFVQGAAGAAAAIEAVAPELGALMTDAAMTLAALDQEGLDRTLAAAPGAEGAATAALGAAGPVLADAEAIAADLAPAGAILEDSLARVDAVVRAATPVARATGELAGPMDDALRAVGELSENPAARGAIAALGGEDLATFGGSAFIGLGAILRTTARAQLNCNVAALWIRNLASIGSEGDSGGNWLRMVPVFGGPDQIQHQATPAPDLHVNYYPRENARECESGNEPYTEGQLIGNPPGRQPSSTEPSSRDEVG